MANMPSASVNMIEVCLEQILNNSSSKVEYANKILDIVRAMDEMQQKLLNELRKK